MLLFKCVIDGAAYKFEESLMDLKTTFIALNDGTEICVPEQENLMTNFVLQEQGDWFEDEIKFVRSFVKPGMQALDIGANYGLYSTAIAKNLKGVGRLWCFEPTQNTADTLRITIKRNYLEHTVELIQAGLSDHLGQAKFYIYPNAELNSLTGTESTNGESQTIELLTLDHCLEQFQWQRIDFIKLDAEGEELNILRRSSKTLSRFSPLIMFELKHGAQINTSLISAFQEQGYQPYKLIPSLNILTPFGLDSPIDGFLLNLFCCKADTAKRLEEDGYLVSDAKSEPAPDGFTGKEFFAQFSYSQNVMPQRPTKDDSGSDYLNALNAYTCSRNTKLDSGQRFGHLSYAFEVVKKILNNGETKFDRLSTLARISFDMGQREIGIQILDRLYKKYLQSRTFFKISQDFVPPGIEFETVDPKGNLKNWLCAAVLDQYIRKHAYSCYFTKTGSLPLFAELRHYGFFQADMAKREAMIRKLQ